MVYKFMIDIRCYQSNVYVWEALGNFFKKDIYNIVFQILKTRWPKAFEAHIGFSMYTIWINSHWRKMKWNFLHLRIPLHMFLILYNVC